MIDTPFERAMAWKTIDGYELVPETANQLETLIKGLFEKRRFLDLIRSFIVFEDDGQTIVKKIAQYHQHHAVNKAVERAVEASGPEGDQKGGVVWHTQGSGRASLMLFFAGKLILEPEMANPTIDADRPERSGRSALWDVQSGERGVAAVAGTGGDAGGAARAADAGSGWGDLYDDPEVPAGCEGGHASIIERPPQHHRDGGRGAPEPVRLREYGIGGGDSGCVAECHLRSVYGYAGGAGGIGIRGSSLGITSISTMWSKRCGTARRCRSITKAGW